MRSPFQHHAPKIERQPLSVICTSATDRITERNQYRLLRPIFINGVEVGFAYSKGSDTMKKLSARGITICLWYFISRGHQAQALLPFCFKNYPDKSNGWDELMALYRMNLVEFTPGFGSDKYVEVNRIMATRARKYGGCMVARSQMHLIVEQDPMLDRTVEQKLLMPSFNGDDIIFPIDGPLGRNGSTFAETLTCTIGDPEWSRCVLQQMTLRDQQIWMTNLANAVQNSRWIAVAGKVCRHQSSHFVSFPLDHPPIVFELHPPETNPPENRGFSKLQYRARQDCLFDINGRYHRPSYNNNYTVHFSNRRKNWASNHGILDGNNYFLPSYRRNPCKYDRKMSYIGRPNSIYRLHIASRTSTGSKIDEPVNKEQNVVAARNYLANGILEYSKSKSIWNRNSNLFGAKDNPDEVTQTVEDTRREHEDRGIMKDINKKQEQRQSNEKEQNKKEKELLMVEDSICSEEIKKHSVEGDEKDANATEQEIQLVSLLGNKNTAFSVINANLPLECGLNGLGIGSGSDDAKSVLIGTTSRDNENDLIHFSDYELDNDDSVHEARTVL